MSDWSKNLEEARENKKQKVTKIEAAIFKVGPRNYARPNTIPAERFAQGSYLDFYIRRTGEDGVQREELHQHYGDGKLWSTDISPGDKPETYKACSNLQPDYGIGAVLALWALTAGSSTEKGKSV